VIEVEGLRKAFGTTVAVDDLSFVARPGVIFGLLGPNGAGKSTTIGCISGLLAPTAGCVRVLGHDVVHDGTAARRGLGIVPQELALYEDLSARRNLAYWGTLHGLPGPELPGRVAQTLDLVGLAERADDPVSAFSGGMKRRLNFACGVVHDPRVLLLDEPTVGVDPHSRVRVLDLVREQARAGRTVLYTTHYMEEAESLCDELAIVDAGRLVAQGTLEQLRGLIAERDLLRLSGRFDAPATRAALTDLDVDVEVSAIDEQSATLAVADAPRHLSAIFGALASAGAELQETTLSRPSLESLFIKLTGRELRE